MKSSGRRTITTATTRRNRFCDEAEIAEIGAPAVDGVLTGDRTIPVLRQSIGEGLLRRVGRRIENIVLSKIASELLNEIYARDRFESRSGYGRRTTSVYVSKSSIGTMLVLSRKDTPGHAVSFEMTDYSNGHIVVRIEDDLNSVKPVCSHKDIDGVVAAIIADVAKTRRERSAGPSGGKPSFVRTATSMPLVYGATTFGGLGALAGMWFGLDMIAVLAMAGAATSIASGRPIIGRVIEALSDLADEMSQRMVPTEKPDEEWASLENDIRDGSRLRERFEAARSRLTGSIDLADVEALALMEGTLTRISRSHARAMKAASSVKRERSIVADSRKALEHVIAAAEFRIDQHSDAEMREHLLATSFAIERSRQEPRSSLH